MYIQKLNNSTNKISPQIYTADFETVIKRNKHVLVAYSIYTNNLIISKYFNSDKISELQIAEMFINHLLKCAKNQNIIVYMHNLGSFDGVILLNALKQSIFLDKMNLVIRNNSFYQIKIGNNIKIRDSYKLIPKSLDEISLNLIGKGKIKVNFTDTQFANNKSLILRYCLNDSKLLFTILCKLNKTMISLYSTSITESMTMSSLTFKIFRKFFCTNNLIANSNKFKDNIYDLICKSYRGGITEVYIPYGEKLNYYDINSSYPYAMLNNMPTGLPTEVKGSDIDLDVFFGFLKIIIKVKGEKIPFLGIKKNGVNIYPNGQFTISVFSEELKYAMQINNITIIKIISGISFKPQKIFNKFVLENFEKRQNSSNNIDKLIYKSILNFLYGRLGMKRNTNYTKLIKNSNIHISNVIFNQNVIFKSKNRSLISGSGSLNESDILQIIDKFDPEDKLIILDKIRKFHLSQKNSLSAIHISSAIAAYARIKIDQEKRHIFKMGGSVYYSDTDSIVTNLNLNTSDNIGDLKLEYKLKKAYFISPKVYMLITKDNNRIIKFKGLESLHSNLQYSGDNFESIFKLALLQKSKPTKLVVKTPIKKNFRKMIIKSTVSAYSVTFNLKKRIKV